MHDQRAEILNAYHIMMAIKLGRDTVSLMQTPMFHAASIYAVVGGPAIGGHIVILPIFEPKAVMEAIEAYRPTITAMVPTMIGLTLAHPDFRPDRLAGLNDLVYGASPMPQALLEILLGMYPNMNIWQGYGMTEACSVVTMLGPEEHRKGETYLRSAGYPVMGVELSIQDPQVEHCRRGTPERSVCGAPT